MPFFFNRGHFESVRALLLAGDVQARVVEHAADPVKGRSLSYSISVTRSDGAQVLWTNSDKTWQFTVVREDGETVVGRTGFPQSLDPESVAKLIAVSELPERDFSTYDTALGQYVMSTGEVEADG